ncbi:MAG: Holliday junction resolvase RuvX [SAR202 cluster bacterium]|nr:Holliday junction resolvase RuvX [SAR202 cluster bacterium]
MALDVGDVRIGVAISDVEGRMAFPHSAVRRGEPDDIAQIVLLATEEGVKEIVVGMPLHLSGQPGAQAKEVRRFIKSLAAATPTRIITLDERYSSVQAQRMLRDSGEKPSRDKGRIDAAAATVLLQAYLDAGRMRRRATP